MKQKRDMKPIIVGALGTIPKNRGKTIVDPEKDWDWQKKKRVLKGWRDLLSLGLQWKPLVTPVVENSQTVKWIFRTKLENDDPNGKIKVKKEIIVYLEKFFVADFKFFVSWDKNQLKDNLLNIYFSVIKFKKNLVVLFGGFSCVLWRITPSRLFNAKSSLYTYQINMICKRQVCVV